MNKGNWTVRIELSGYIDIYIIIHTSNIPTHVQASEYQYTGMIIFPGTIRIWSQNLIYDTQFLQFLCAHYFCNGMKISKEQHIDEHFLLMVCTVVNVVGCLSTVYGCKHNCSVSKKYLYTYEIHYTAAICVWFLV